MICPCCGIEHESLRESCWVSVPVCIDCLDAWYDGGTANAALIRERSRQRQGFANDARSSQMNEGARGLVVLLVVYAWVAFVAFCTGRR
jgi:Zn-finger nucleic acid-binding protein